ncbi:MAG: MMPL family transporter, partial [Deltaproteobacteria bacterium]|nr:MMPL family transporter [Deltaproteobacteria bacterium]
TSTLFPIAFLVVVVLLYLTLGRAVDVVASVITILFSVAWTVGAMGAIGMPLQVLTQITPIIVMIISISDSVHVISHYKTDIAAGASPRAAIVSACRDSALPCLLTELTIAGGFLGLLANDILLIQQFGLITALGMLLTWLANFTVLPLSLRFLKPRAPLATADERLSRVAGVFQRFLGRVERAITLRPRRVVTIAVLVVGASILFGSRVRKEFYVFDDLRPEHQIAANIRTIDGISGGTVPLAIYVETRDGKRHPDAMLDPSAIALIDRMGRKLETDFPDQIKNTSSLAKFLRKAHLLLAGEDLARESPLPSTKRLVAQELLAIEDPRSLRDVLSFDRATAAVITMVPDGGSSRMVPLLRELRRYLAEEEAATGYRLTLTGILGVADGVYHSLVDGLVGSLAVSVLLSFAIFCLVLRSWRLAVIALVPNLLPLCITLGFMGLLNIEIKPSTVVLFSITLVIADDDTIQYMVRLRRKIVELKKQGVPDPYREASITTLHETGLPMFVTACAVSLGFLVLLLSQFVGLANLGLLIGMSLLSAVVADLFLSPLLIMKLKPNIGAGSTEHASEEKAVVAQGGRID